jgi:hypothetical protein
MKTQLQPQAANQPQPQDGIHEPSHQTSSLATRLFTMGLAGFMFASCSREKPFVAEYDQLKGPLGAELVEKRVAINVTASFVKEVDDSYFFQPPPIIISDGKSTTIIPQVGYWIDDTDYVYSATVNRKDKDPVCLGTVKNENRIAEGDSFLIAKFLGVDEEGNPKLCTSELVSPATLKAELEEK